MGAEIMSRAERTFTWAIPWGRAGIGARLVARLVEETLASPYLYLRLGVPPEASPTPTDAGVADAGIVTPDAGPPVTSAILLASGESLTAGASKASGVFTLLNQLDGNLVLYRSGAALWASGTAGASAPGPASMQGDGNLVVYAADGRPSFSSGTQGNPGALLRIDANGRLFILATDGRELWSGVP